MRKEEIKTDGEEVRESERERMKIEKHKHREKGKEKGRKIVREGES